MVTRLPWEPQFYVNNSSVLSSIEVLFGVKVSCYGNQVMMAIVVILE